MARKNYSDEFRRQAVDLYESTPGATLKGIAADLGVVRGTLKHWVDQYGTGKKTAADGTTTTRPISSSGGSQPPSGPEAPEAKIARLEARVCLEELVARVADYDIDVDGIRRVHSVNVRGFASLPTTVVPR